MTAAVRSPSDPHQTRTLRAELQRPAGWERRGGPPGPQGALQLLPRPGGKGSVRLGLGRPPPARRRRIRPGLPSLMGGRPARRARSSSCPARVPRAGRRLVPWYGTHPPRPPPLPSENALGRSGRRRGGWAGTAQAGREEQRQRAILAGRGGGTHGGGGIHEGPVRSDEKPRVRRNLTRSLSLALFLSVCLCLSLSLSLSPSLPPSLPPSHSLPPSLPLSPQSPPQSSYRKQMS